MNLDVLCIGVACYDLTFMVAEHPLPDAKSYASATVGCGGGLAANAAVAAARLGSRCALISQLGSDPFGDRHLRELQEAGVVIDFVRRHAGSTKLSVILAKADGTRSLIHYAGDQQALSPAAVDFTSLKPSVVLVDGHELVIAQACCRWARSQSIATVLDADSVKPGAVALLSEVDYLVCSRGFAAKYTGLSDTKQALKRLASIASTVVITLGAEGLLWHHQDADGHLPALPVAVVDSTGAGDAFHGAFAACLAAGKSWQETLATARAVGAFCCTRIGARIGLPTRQELADFLTGIDSDPFIAACDH